MTGDLDIGKDRAEFIITGRYSAFFQTVHSYWNGPRTSFTVVSLDRLAYLRWSLSGPINRQRLLGTKLPMEPPSDASPSLPSVCHPPPNRSAGGQMHLSNNGRLGLSPLVQGHDCPVFHYQYLASSSCFAACCGN
ncbi:hypothetical protein FSHL1_003100 [Fusarium sambucinum]